MTRNDWISDGTKVCEDERTLVFGEDEFGRYIDFAVTITATEGDVTFGETKEGSFGVRANAPLTVDSKQGAHLVEQPRADGRQGVGHVRRLDRRLWPGRRRRRSASPCSAIPSNYRHPTRWHARTYGLLAANPFGEGDFPKDDSQPKQGPKTLAKGEKLPLRYRVLLHSGDPQEANVQKAYEKFIAGIDAVAER